MAYATVKNEGLGGFFFCTGRCQNRVFTLERLYFSEEFPRACQRLADRMFEAIRINACQASIQKRSLKPISRDLRKCSQLRCLWRGVIQSLDRYDFRTAKRISEKRLCTLRARSSMTAMGAASHACPTFANSL